MSHSIVISGDYNMEGDANAMSDVNVIKEMNDKIDKCRESETPVSKSPTTVPVPKSPTTVPVPVPVPVAEVLPKVEKDKYGGRNIREHNEIDIGRCDFFNGDVKCICAFYDKYFTGDVLDLDRYGRPIFSWESNVDFAFALARLDPEWVLRGREILYSRDNTEDVNHQNLLNEQIKNGTFSVPLFELLLMCTTVIDNQHVYVKRTDSSTMRKYLQQMTVKTWIELLCQFPRTKKYIKNMLTKGFPCFPAMIVEFGPSKPSVWPREINKNVVNVVNEYPGHRFKGVRSTSQKKKEDICDYAYIYRYACESSNIARFIMECTRFHTEDELKYFFGYHKLLLSGVRVPIVVLCVGAAGNGKTAIMSELPDAVLAEGYVVSSSDTGLVTGNFDSIVEGAIANVFDDPKNSCVKEAEMLATKSKSIATGKKITTVRKYKDAKSTYVTTTLIIISNNYYVYKIDRIDRRTFCIEFNDHPGGWKLEDIKHTDRLDKSVHDRLEKGGVMTGREVTCYIAQLINGAEGFDHKPCPEAIQSYLDFINTDGIGHDAIRYRSAPPCNKLRRDIRYYYMSEEEKFIYNCIYYGCQWPIPSGENICPVGWDYENNVMQLACSTPITSKQLYDLYLAWYSYQTLGQVVPDYELLTAKGCKPIQLKSFERSISGLCIEYSNNAPVKSGKMYKYRSVDTNGKRSHKANGSYKYFICQGEVEDTAIDINMDDYKMEFNPYDNPKDATFNRDLELILRDENNNRSNIEPNFIIKNKLAPLRNDAKPSN